MRWLATRGILFVLGVVALGVLAQWGGWYTFPAALVGALVYWAGVSCGVNMERERDAPPYRSPREE